MKHCKVQVGFEVGADSFSGNSVQLDLDPGVCAEQVFVLQLQCEYTPSVIHKNQITCCEWVLA